MGFKLSSSNSRFNEISQLAAADFSVRSADGDMDLLRVCGNVFQMLGQSSGLQLMLHRLLNAHLKRPSSCEREHRSLECNSSNEFALLTELISDPPVDLVPGFRSTWTQYWANVSHPVMLINIRLATNNQTSRVYLNGGLLVSK